MTPFHPFSARVLAGIALLSVVACTIQDPGPDRVEPVLEKEATASGPGERTEIRVRTLLEWLQEPWGMDFLPDGRLLITEKPGVMKLVTPRNWATPCLPI